MRIAEFCKFERHFRGADWRQQLANEAAQSGRPLRPAVWDNLVLRTADYYRQRGPSNANCATAAAKHPDIAQADTAWSDPKLRERLQILVLGDCDPDEIAGRLGLPLATVKILEDLFFDVRSSLDASVWIVHKVIDAARANGDNRLAERLKLAYFGGPCAARALLDGEDIVPVDPAERLTMAIVGLSVKLQEALAMKITSAQGMDFFKIYADIHRAEQEIALDREKLKFRVARWAQKRELAQARLDLERSRPPRKDDEAAPRAGAATAPAAAAAAANSTTVAV